MGNSALRPIHNQSNIIHTKFILRKKRDKSKTNRICKNRTELRKRLERSRGALGSDAAIEASDVVIRDDSLEKVSEAKHLSKKQGVSGSSLSWMLWECCSIDQSIWNKAKKNQRNPYYQVLTSRKAGQHFFFSAFSPTNSLHLNFIASFIASRQISHLAGKNIRE